MTTSPWIVDEAETLVRHLATELTGVRDGECLCCYVGRQLDQFGCDCTLRHAIRFRDLSAPRATALKERLGRVGGYCDCEIFLNGYALHRRFWTNPAEVEEDGVIFDIDAAPPEQLPVCAGVRRGSARPCANWVRLR